MTVCVKITYNFQSGFVGFKAAVCHISNSQTVGFDLDEGYVLKI